MKNNSLNLLGRELAAKGIAVLRIDKRGVAESIFAGLKEDELRFDTYVADAVLWLGWLKADKRFSKIGVVGHSEGSLIGMLAAKAANADAFVSVCGPGRPAGDVLREQFGKNLPEKLQAESKQILAELEAGRTVKDPPAELAALFRPSVQPYLISWLSRDPATALAELNSPVLLIDGTTDIQISLADGDRLVKTKPGVKRVTLKKMNHVLKEVSSTNQLLQTVSYIDPIRPLHPKLVSTIATFLSATLGGI